MEGGDIDVNRVIDGHLLSDDYFCSICRNVLWKPRTCSSCQHLFCQKCIHTWLEYSKSARKCPFRCENFQERACAPEFYASLSQLKVRCRNGSFGCLEVLAYDALERHENSECKYLTKTCPQCAQLVLTSELKEHVQVPGKCIPCPIRCTICQELVEVDGFRAHFGACYNERIQNLFMRYTEERAQRNIQENGNVPLVQRDAEFVLNMMAAFNAFEHQRQNSRLPTTLKGVDMVRQARERGCGHLYHIFLMIRFFIMNGSRAPFLIWIMSLSTLIAIGLIALGIYVACLRWIEKHMCTGVLIIMLWSGLLSFGIPYFFQMVNDTWIISCYCILLFILTCTLRGALESYEIEMLMDRTILNIFICAFGIMLVKVFILGSRLFFWYVPGFVTAAMFSIINILLALKLRSVIEVTPTVNVV